MEVAEVDERPGVVRDRRERVPERGFGRRPVAQAHQRHPPLVECEGAARPVALRREDRVQARERLGEAPRGQRRDGLVELGARATPAQRTGEDAADVEHRSAVFRVDVVTLFPEVFAPAIALSILGRARERGVVEIEVHDILDALGPGERADDRPYGGGPGMVLRLAPLARILDGIIAAAPQGERRAVVVTSPAGRPFRHADAERLAALDRVVFVCGHYEGIDDRLAALYGAEELSLGDFVLTGGEIPALAFLDATVRLRAGAVSAESLVQESFAEGALEAPAFTRPAAFRGAQVPEVLLSGDHARIAQWRRQRSRDRTLARRPDLIEKPETPAT